VLGYDHGGVGEVLNDIFPQGKVPLNNPVVLYQKVLWLLQSQITIANNPLFSKQMMLSKTLALYAELKHRQ